MTFGVLFNTDRLDGPGLVDYARRLDRLGVGSLWLAELFGREPFATAGWLLACTERITVATGIANVYARDAVATATASTALAELSGGRFTLGLGVSNAGMGRMRGHAWEPPVAKMAAYLDAVRSAQVTSPKAGYPIVVASHGPKMQALAAEKADGLLSYVMPVSHTERTRAAIGAGPSLTPMVMGLRCEDPVEARRLARRALGMYMGLDYYHRAWRTLGFEDADFAGGGSDRLVDAIVAWGDEAAIAARIRAHHDAGADHVCIQPLRPDGIPGPDLRLLEALAPARR